MSRLAIVLVLLIGGPLAAQGGGTPAEIPPGHMPPPGMCRIWIDGVPAGRQPAPTDCATAIRRRPPNARVIFGPEVRPSARGGNAGVLPLPQFRDERPPEAQRARDVQPQPSRDAERRRDSVRPPSDERPKAKPAGPTPRPVEPRTPPKPRRPGTER